MGSYITKAHVDRRWGEQNIIVWSNLDNDATTADTDRIDDAIAYAEAWVEDHFRGGRYLVPFVALSGSMPPTILQWCATIAGIWLYQGRPARNEDIAAAMADIEDAVEQQIAPYIRGTRRLNCQPATTMPTGPTAV